MDNFCLDSLATTTLIAVLLSQKCILGELGVQREKKNQWWSKETQKIWEIKHLL